MCGSQEVRIAPNCPQRWSRRESSTPRVCSVTASNRKATGSRLPAQFAQGRAAGNAPDVIFIDNYIHVEGGKTAMGSFDGMQSNAALSSQLVPV